MAKPVSNFCALGALRAGLLPLLVLSGFAAPSWPIVARDLPTPQRAALKGGAPSGPNYYPSQGLPGSQPQPQPLASTLMAASTPAPISVFTAVPVSDGGINNSLAFPNTTRKVAVGPDGTIYVAYHEGRMMGSPTLMGAAAAAPTGLRVARSLNRGASFLPSVQVTSQSAEGEITTGANGDVFVAWDDGEGYRVSVSTDHGQTFSSGVALPGGGPAPHIVADLPYLYVKASGGDAGIYWSANGAPGPWTYSAVAGSTAFGELLVDRSSHTLWSCNDNPSFDIFTSLNRGLSFGADLDPTDSLGGIFYSSWTLSSSPAGVFAFVSGQGSPAYRINLANGTSQALTFGLNGPSQTRQIVADARGNVGDGFSNGGSVFVSISNDLGNSFSSPTLVSGSAINQSLAFNETFRDLDVAYETGGRIYLNVYNLGTVYDLSFLDDNGRMRVCLNSTTGEWKAVVLLGPAAGTYTGQVTPTSKNGALVLPALLTPGPRLNGFYNAATRQASFWLTNTGKIAAQLFDTNTTAQAGGCGTQLDD